MLQFQQHLFRAFFFLQMTSCAMCIMMSFIIPSPSILNIWRHGGLTALTLLLQALCWSLGKALTFFSKFNPLEMGYSIFWEREGGRVNCSVNVISLTEQFIYNYYILYNFFLSISNQVNQIFWKGCDRYQSIIKSGGLILAWDTTTAMYPQLS